jgi:hypothetical protein
MNRKTIVIYTPDDRAYAGATAADVVARMLEANVFTAAKSPAEYMRGVASRCATLNGDVICTDSPSAFLDDLVRHGVITFGDAH